MRSNAAAGNEGEGDSVSGVTGRVILLLNDCAQLLTMLLRSSFPEYPAGAIVIERSSSSVLQLGHAISPFSLHIAHFIALPNMTRPRFVPEHVEHTTKRLPPHAAQSTSPAS